MGSVRQVMNPKNVGVHNRQDHSLVVAKTSIELGKRIGVDAALVEFAALAHDLGHPPIGHSGEKRLNAIALEVGLDGFEGNAQTFHILTRLEPAVIRTRKKFKPRKEQSVQSRIRYYGSNHTRAALDAAIKYPWFHNEKIGAKFGVYRADRAAFEFVRQGVPVARQHTKCVEAQVMDWADDIAYSTHDFEDAILGGILDPLLLLDPKEQQRIIEKSRQHGGLTEQQAKLALARVLNVKPLAKLLKKCATEPTIAQACADGTIGTHAEVRALIGQAREHLVERFVDGAGDATRAKYRNKGIGRHDGNVEVPQEMRAQTEILKAITWIHVIDSEKENTEKERQVEQLAEIAYTLLNNADHEANPQVLTAIEDFTAQRNSIFGMLWEQARAVVPDDAELRSEHFGALPVRPGGTLHRKLRHAQNRLVIDAVATLRDAEMEALWEKLDAYGVLEDSLAPRMQAPQKTKHVLPTTAYSQRGTAVSR
ncbi:MAG: HD domain-containing protein [Corynebacteriales bacterium]|nr:HD domain-containing protein [Mycobacteriales bacterium]